MEELEPHDYTESSHLAVREPAEADVGLYRDLMSSFPTGVSVVTTIDGDGRPRGATCTSLTSVTLSPPTLLVCLNERGGTLRAVLASRRFAVNLLHAGGRRAATVFSSRCVDKFADVASEPWACFGLPFLHHDAFAVAACEVAEDVHIGDHRIVIGRVLDIRVSPGVPLTYGLRHFLPWPLAVPAAGARLAKR
ncbi:hypothetical protein GCM10023321_45040 [Pseudonocardia eucalypti]|uniref:Flavin reductase like domain-containing protein n=2 Tax=Pseudonocardia eucalypti TaxID=648755 RepID=A0ABP9QFR9_9PSEU